MLSLPLVSVIVPVYNAEPYLAGCLRSLLDQTHPRLELICVDDGSTDSSVATVEAFASKDPRLLLLRAGHRGPGHARNLGLAEARGEFLAFVDADDALPPNSIRSRLAILEETGSDLVTGRVMRVTSTDMWPSRLHDHAIPRTQLRTHITQETSLLNDIVAWNKLYRHDFWDRNGFRFLEGCHYEEVRLMVEAHCRASSVDMTREVVAHWRVREDGNLSITQQLLQANNLEDRLASLISVRELVQETSLQNLGIPWECKALRNDIPLYLSALLRANAAFQDHFVALVSEYLAGVPDSLFASLDPSLAAKYRLVQLGDVPHLLALLEHERDNGGKLPVICRGRSVRLDVGAASAVLPKTVMNARRSLAVQCGVQSVSWTDERLVLEGFAFIRAVPLARRTSALRRLILVDKQGGRSFAVRLKARENPETTARYGLPGVSYTWSGFRAEVPWSRLRPIPGADDCEWSVAVEVISPTAIRRAALAHPSGGARFVPPQRGADGRVCSVRWSRANRLVIHVGRETATVTHAEMTDELVRLGLRLDAVGASDAELRAVLRRRGGSDETLVSRIRCLGVDDTGRMSAIAEFFLRDLLVEAGRQAWLLEIDAGGETCRVRTEFKGEVVLAGATGTVVVRAGRMGEAIVRTTEAYVRIEDARWDADRLVLTGTATVPRDAPVGLLLRNRRGDQLRSSEVRVGNSFEASFEVLAIAGPEGTHPASAGQWHLHRAVGGDSASMPKVAVLNGRAATLESARRSRPPDIKLWVDRRSFVSLTIHDLPVRERGRYAQARIQKRDYPGYLRSPLRDVVLFESWGGKQFSDNPRALLEEAIRREDLRELAVVVEDYSIVTPRGVQVVRRWSREYYRLLATARLIVGNDKLTKQFVKRPGQRYLQTWHGTPLKKIGFDMPSANVGYDRYLRELAPDVAKWDWLVSPNPFSTEVLRNAFRFDGAMLETGYPRNDVFFRPEARLIRSRVREWLGIPAERKIVLWAPTWRDDQFGRGGSRSFAAPLDMDRLQQQLGADHVLLFRGHHLVMDRRHLPPDDEFFHDVSKYPDIRDLYLAADALVTDYSSVMFDFALTGKPILFFVWDLLHYRDELRGFYLDLAEIAPGPLLTNQEALVGALADLPSVVRDHAAHYQEFRDRFCSLEDGGSSARVWERITQQG